MKSISLGIYRRFFLNADEIKYLLEKEWSEVELEETRDY